jgi:GNAT superfamily N-acetyltransferase
MPKGKRFKSYPAMKIGRLGVSEKYKGAGIGTMIIDYLKELFISNNRTGCKYITVDAYNLSLSFYEKNGFNYLTQSDEGKATRLMYFDLILMKQEN